MSHWYEDHPGMTPADWGRLNYEAYAAHRATDPAIAGIPLKPWDEVPDAIRDAWSVAAQAVRQHAAQAATPAIHYVIDSHRAGRLSEGNATAMLSPLGIDRLAVRDLTIERDNAASDWLEREKAKPRDHAETVATLTRYPPADQCGDCREPRARDSYCVCGPIDRICPPLENEPVVVFPGPADSVEAAGNDGFDSGTMFIMAKADGKPIPAGCRYEENPHPEGSPEHKAWADEWVEASGK